MTRRTDKRRRGVVLLLILGLTAMFALSILTFMMVTSNMADTAQNQAKIDAVVEPSAQEEFGVALKTALVGTNNERDPIGPFGVLENMYGDWVDYDYNGNQTDGTFDAYVALFPEMGFATITPLLGADTNGDGMINVTADADNEYDGDAVKTLFEQSGGVLTFVDGGDSVWQNAVGGSSTFVLEKMITNPIAWSYDGATGQYWRDHYYNAANSISSSDVGNQNAYWPCDYWHLRVELTDELKSFVGNVDVEDFNTAQNVVKVRLNRPAYSGTGAGGFSPGEIKDAQVNEVLFPSWDASAAMGMPADALRIPYAFWTNASAPDLAANVNLKGFRGYWNHLLGSCYEYGTGWRSFGAPIRMNSQYTAPDSRTLFLAHFADGLIPTDNLNGKIVPSFHRPSLFNALVNGGFLHVYSSIYDADAAPAALTALVRKLTPRPLTPDHWKFNGGVELTNGVTDPSAFANYLAGGVDGQWDVDNDGDGVREGVWIPSGLPIRVDKHGTPYATMFSYTIVDLDGRVDVNAAGTWDQLPNRAASGGDLLGRDPRPFDYVDEIVNAEPSGAILGGQPYFNVNAPAYGWLDDKNIETKIAARGDGLGAANVRLYEALAAIYGSRSDGYVAALAESLIWRRGLRTDENPTGSFASGVWNYSTNSLNWNLARKFDSQPGATDASGVELDDRLATQYNFFRFMNPFIVKYEDGIDNEYDEAPAEMGSRAVKYPWRGKSTVDMTAAMYYQTFDFANSAFRSYDPLGAQIFTYPPQYTDNPYLAYKNVSSWYDSPYSLPMLERLLRPFDADSGHLPPQLASDLGAIGSTNGDETLERERAVARTALTTISADVPAPSLVFPDGAKTAGVRDGAFGFADLIRRCVRAEFEKIFEEKGIWQESTNPNFFPGTNAFIYDNANNQAVFEAKVEEIASYLIAMLPPEIQAGQKIDLNKLSQKDYWLDVEYDETNGTFKVASDELHNVGLVKRMEYARGLYLVVTTLLYEDMNAGRLYRFEDDGQGNVYRSRYNDYFEGGFDLENFKAGEDLKDYADQTINPTYAVDVDGNEVPVKRDGERGLMAKELIATRIAQWCVNAVDFADPDATMTPFFFDPTPFDGWWVENNNAWIEDSAFKGAFRYNRWEIGKPYQLADGTEVGPGDDPNLLSGWGVQPTGYEVPETHFLFATTSGMPGVPTEQMAAFFLDAFNGAKKYDKTQASSYLGWDGLPLKTKEKQIVGGVETEVERNKTDAEVLADWLNRGIGKLEDQTTDLGFRLVWGMERPDLLLTETLNFHDLGIADTQRDKDSAGADGSADPNAGTVQGGSDLHFDQVKRPEGSTYLELYCAANPNVPQSPELYDYVEDLSDTNNPTQKMWRLRLSKLTPVYTDSNGRELEMPVWRVAISDSSDPRALIGDDEEEKQEAVYRKKWNSVLERLTKDSKEFSFLSMQTKQFRNLPLSATTPDATLLQNIAALDLFQGMEEVDDPDNPGQKKKVAKTPNPALIQADWQNWNLRGSNVLGSGVAAKEKRSRKREIELDRVVWFACEENLDTVEAAGAYPDSFRTFANVAPGNVYLAPNGYLVVGPEEKRSIGSVAFNASSDENDDMRFGVKPPSDSDHWIDLKRLSPLAGNYKHIVAKSLIGDKDANENGETVDLRRGLNISEPLWTSFNDDPYYYDQAKKIDTRKSPTDGVNGSKDIPFEMPRDWTTGELDSLETEEFRKSVVANYPIVQDELFGLGTVPAYKSAFVQRVADPNRPYHPVLNPYISVDWNIMDLTVFTGESVEIGGTQNQYWFAEKSEGEGKMETGNQITFDDNAKKRALLKEDETPKIAFEDAFSSRQWGSASQKTFAPTREGKFDDQLAVGPNPWSRAVGFEHVGNNAGLEKPGESNKYQTGQLNVVAMGKIVPTHTLGFYNNRGPRGSWTEIDGAWTFVDNPTGGPTYRGLYDNQTGAPVYNGAPRVPFEHLVWNDAPFSAPFELTLVPASSPGRFGLEFVRTQGAAAFDLKKLSAVEPNDTTDAADPNKGKGEGLGTNEIFGFDWYDGKGKIGPNLNFFASSDYPGETLNLCKALEFVHTPSLFLGTKRLATYGNGIVVNELIRDGAGDWFGTSNPVFYSARREPGKVNINTLTESVWKAISPASERLAPENRLPGTAWDNGEDPNANFTDARNWYATTPSYFRPAHTAPLWATLTQDPAPLPASTTLLTGKDFSMSSDATANKEPLFDNVGVVRNQKVDKDGNPLYERVDGSSGEMTQAKADEQIAEWNAANEEANWLTFDDDYRPVLDGQKNNMYEATAEIQRLSGMTTTRSNAFAVWVTVGYFEVERCNPGVNMPNVDPSGNTFNAANMIDPSYPWYEYYQAIYPDGYTYGKELGSEFGETKRRRGFAIIDRSVPVDYRRGSSVNWQDAVLLKRILD